MSKSRPKSRKSGRSAGICQEKFACSTDKEIAIVTCTQCKTLQCAKCEEELHKDGEWFFHERVKLKLPVPSIPKSDPTQSAHLNIESSLAKGAQPNIKNIPPHTEAKVLPASQVLLTSVNTEQAQSDNQQVVASGGVHPSSTTTNAYDRSAGDPQRGLTDKDSDIPCLHPVQALSEVCSDQNQEVDIFSTATVYRPPSLHIDYNSIPLDETELEVPEFDSGEFNSLGLDSILSSDLSLTSDMKGQSKSSKRSKPHQPRSPMVELNAPPSFGDNGDYSSAWSNTDAAPDEFAAEQSDEALISDLMKSMTTAQVEDSPSPQHNGFATGHQSGSATGHQRGSASTPVAKSRNRDSASRTAPAKHTTTSTKSFLLIDEAETIQVDKASELLQKLGCENVNVKVVSIFGNTGDGKSYTLNQLFFGGQEVFATSADQRTCTVGVWAAYDPVTKVICIDTEGLLGITSNTHKRTRLLLKILAVSDVIIYRTSADRLHTDLFQFLGDASVAYSKHFKVELESVNGHRWQDLGPSVVVFHETTRTNTLDMSGGTKSADELLRERFATLKYDMSSFSSIRYVGVKTTQPPTDFDPLTARVREEVENCSMRTPRSPVIIYDMLKVLNNKFRGEMYSHSPSSFPDEFFTCSSKCLACQSRCTLSMNHNASHEHKGDCRYVHVYDNKVYICKICFQKGRKNVVVPKTCASEDNSLMGVAKYAWAGYVLECRDCGIIYKSRQHWYGNKDPTETEVQIEIRHIWPGQAAMPTGTHNAARKLLDGVKVMADTVGAYSSKPTKMLSDWAADRVAPPYWVPNAQVLNCSGCYRTFDEHEKKHHCRRCGQGFCDECTQYSKPVPEKGWGPSPVRVCEKCYNSAPGTVTGGGEGESNSLMPRQIVENVQSMLGAVASVAIDYPIDLIKDSARPAYWIPDHLIKNCHLCEAEFGPKLAIHHCRACGNGVCRDCSDCKRQVPSKGWDKFVRVCDTCYKKEGTL